MILAFSSVLIEKKTAVKVNTIIDFTDAALANIINIKIHYIKKFNEIALQPYATLLFNRG
jgi:hypothetical protein